MAASPPTIGPTSPAAPGRAPGSILIDSTAERSAVFEKGGHLYMLVAALFTGVMGAAGAVAFRLLIRTVQAVAFEGPGPGIEALLEEGLTAEASDPLAAATHLSAGWRIVIPMLGGAIVGPLIYYFAREARGHGIPEVMKAVARRGGIIRPRIVAVKALASAVSIGTGGSVGREGPIVQIGSAFGSTLGQWLKLDTMRIRTLVGCGAAAGISATFNAPIAGAIFAAEIIVGNFAVSQFTPIVFSSVVATVLSRFFLGNHPAFVVPPYEIVSPFELLPYLVSGALAGLVAVAFIKSISFFEDLFERSPIPEPARAAVGGAIVGGIAVWLPQVYGVGYSSITMALAGSMGAALMAILVVAKIGATSITIGSGGSGGVFAPSLFLGAMTGGVVGTLVEQYFPGATATSGAYALVTMGAVVAAATHAPISAIIIIYELTLAIEIIPALMTACVVSTLVAQLLDRESIYTSKLMRQGIDLQARQDPNVLKGLFVRDVMKEGAEVIPESTNFQAILDLVVQSDHSQFFVVAQDGKLLGAISLSELRRLIYEVDHLQHLIVARDLVDGEPPAVTPEQDLATVMHLFSGSHVDELAVVERGARHRLLGTIREKDMIDASNQEQIRRDLAGGVASSVAALEPGRTVELGGDYVLKEILALPYMCGHNLRELAIRERTGVQVLLVREHGEHGKRAGLHVANAEACFEEGQTLVVAGTRDGIRALETHRG